MKEAIKQFLITLIKSLETLRKAFWKFLEMYAHERANGRRFDWKKLLEPQPQYYKIGIDMNLFQFLLNWSDMGDND